MLQLSQDLSFWFRFTEIMLNLLHCVYRSIDKIQHNKYKKKQMIGVGKDGTCGRTRKILEPDQNETVLDTSYTNFR